MSESINDVLSGLRQLYPWYFNDRRCLTMTDAYESRASRNEGIIERVATNKFLQRAKQFLYTGSEAGALGQVVSDVLRAAYPEQIGREMVRIYESKEPKIRIPAIPRLAAYRAGPGATVPPTTPNITYIDLDVNDPSQGAVFKARSEWDISFVTAANWEAIREITASIGSAIAVEESKFILSCLRVISDDELAGGGSISLGDAPITFDDVLDLKGAVDGEERAPAGRDYKCFLHPKRMIDLLKDQKFINSMIWGQAINKERGEIGVAAGIRFYQSSLIPEGEVWLLNPERAVAMLIHIDLTVEPIETSSTTSGVEGYEYIAARVLDGRAVAKGTIP